MIMMMMMMMPSIISLFALSSLIQKIRITCDQVFSNFLRKGHNSEVVSKSN